jgi:hypothetical protein
LILQRFSADSGPARAFAAQVLGDPQVLGK